MTFPMYSMMPLDMHSDGGFGAMADSFLHAAESLAENKGGPSFLNAYLPINFLYRHSIELYLKSMIIVIHRSIKIPYGNGKSSDSQEPEILIKGKWKAITSVHGIGDLYPYFEGLVTQNKEAISKVAKTDWSDIPLELKETIKIIHGIDNGSTYFRYPSLKTPQSDNDKSSWKETSYAEILRSMAPKNEPVKAYVEVNEQDEIVNVYKFDSEPLGEVFDALKIAAEILSGAHLGIKTELADGR